MARKKGQVLCEDPVIAFKYGLIDPDSETLKRVMDQLWRAKNYQNSLIKIENDRRAAYRKLTSNEDTEAITTELKVVNEALDAIKTSVKTSNQGARKKQAYTDQQRFQIQALVAEKQRLFEQLTALRKSLKTPELKALIKRSEDEAAQAIRNLRTNGEHGVFWGTYLLREDSVKQSAKLVKVGEDLRFQKAFRGGEGCLGVQIQGGMTVEKLFSGTHTSINILPVYGPEPARGPDGQVSKRSQLRKRVVLQIRLGSTETGKPVWGYFPMILHRPIPESARIKNVRIQLQRIGYRKRWSVIFALQSAVFAVPPATRGTTVAVNVGWRVLDDGIRVGYGVYADGRELDMRVPNNVRSQLDHADGLRSLQDQQFNVMQTELLVWLRVNDPVLAPELREYTKNLHLLKSCRSLEKLYYVWKEHRVAGDEQIFEILHAWRTRYRHLYAWETSERVKAVLRRRDWAQNKAIELLTGCRKLVCEDASIAELARRAAPGREDTALPESRHKRQQMAPGEFRLILKTAAKKRGVEIVVVDSANITKSCHVCGTINTWDQARELDHTCEHCGATWDQDKNAARNLLALSNVPQAEAAE